MKKTILAIIFLTTFVSQAKNILPFSLQKMNGDLEQYQSLDHPGAVFVLEAYFNGCHFCNENAAAVNSLASEYAANPMVQVLDVSNDTSQSEFDEWIENNYPNHPVLNGRSLLRILGTHVYPSTYVVGKDGNIVFSKADVWDNSEVEDIKAAIQNALGDN